MPASDTFKRQRGASDDVHQRVTLWTEVIHISKSLHHQLGRRNLSAQRKLYYLGLLQREKKQAKGGDRGNQYTKVAKRQFDASAKDSAKSAAKIAKEHNVSTRTVERAQVFAKNVE